MKKIVTCVLAIILIFSISCTVVNASDTSTETIRINNTSNVQNNNSINNSNQTTNTIKAESTEQIIQIKDKEEKKLEDYVINIPDFPKPGMLRIMVQKHMV